ncbi:hypothetical protein LIER_14704 [Lithospermum erythrorhizon]|uniref:Reverse transcriptase RNase H-like domain-containing protein n=1 Tax=Lithospermum erythrorhizon TaxID=34254 RepID=A0AAV3Q219_LITER
MQSPGEYKDIQKLTGCLAALSRFISKSEERNLPFFKNLRRASSIKFYWYEECNKALEELNDSVLICDAEGQQRPVCYVSHVLHGVEENYPLIDKFAFALVISSRKLKIYFESRPIQVVTDQPMKRVIMSPQLSRRLTTWAIELSEFDISYVPRTSIRAQALVDFVIECTTPTPQVISRPGSGEPGMEKPEWIMFVDGARNEKGSGSRILIQGPDGITMDRIWVKGDSKLVIDQVRGTCGVKHEPLVKYHAKAVQLAKGFELVVFEYIPRVQNEEADHLSRLVTTYYDELPNEVYVEIREKPAHEENLSLLVLQEPEDWRTPIARYLVKGQLPGDVTEARKIKYRSF